MARGEADLPADLLKTPLVYIHKTDNQGRPLLYAASSSINLIVMISIMNPRFYDKKVATVEQHMQHAVYMMELIKNRFLASADMGVAILIDTADISMSNLDMTFLKFMIQCLEAYYPESLGCALIVNASFIFNGAPK
jgi:hypothetical protein